MTIEILKQLYIGLCFLFCFRGVYRGGRDLADNSQSTVPPRFAGNSANVGSRMPLQDGYNGMTGWHGMRQWENQQSSMYRGGQSGDNRWDVGRVSQQYGSRTCAGHLSGGLAGGLGMQSKWSGDRAYSDGGHWDEVKECADPTDWTKPLPRNEKLEQ